MSDNGEQEFEELLKQITHEKQLLFLEYYPKFTKVVETCKAVGVSRYTPYTWIDKGGVFKLAFLALKKQISNDLIERHEENIDTVAFDGDTPAQSRIFGSLVRLRAEAPDKYREKVTTAPLIGNVIIKLAIPDYKELPETIDVEAKEIGTQRTEED